MKEYSSLTKTCNSCGTQKPLSAFLQMADAKGATYGNICAACRKTALTEKKTPNDADDETKSKTEHKLDYKMRLADEVDKKQRFTEVEELYYKDRELDEEKKSQHLENKETIAKDEKKHRKEYLEKRVEKRSMFDNHRRTDSQKIQPEQVFGGEAQLAEERKIVVSDTVDTQKEKYKSSRFYELKAWLGEGAGVFTAAERGQKMAERAALNKKPEKEESLSEKIDRTLLPPSGRRGK